MAKRDFAFGKENFILIAVAIAFIVIGFVLMGGGASEDGVSFNPEIFSAMRIKVAPVVCFVGFISIIYAIIRKPKDENNAAE